jgi:hypothetical protein
MRRIDPWRSGVELLDEVHERVDVDAACVKDAGGEMREGPGELLDDRTRPAAPRRSRVALADDGEAERESYGYGMLTQDGQREAVDRADDCGVDID